MNNSLSKGMTIRGLKSIRLLCFIIIFCSHAFDNDNLHIFVYLPVTIFFILSAFVLSYRYDGDDLRVSPVDNIKFVFHRIRKSYPLYLIILLFSFLLTSAGAFSFVGNLNTIEKMPSIILHNSLLIQSWFLDKSYVAYGNSVSWFYSALVFYYFLFPYLRKILKDLSSRRSFVVVVLCVIFQIIVYAILILLFDFNVLDSIIFFPPLKIAQFISGICLFNIWKVNRGRLTFNKAILFELFFMFLVVLVFFDWGQFNEIKNLYIRIVSFITALVLIYLFAEEKGILPKLTINRISIYLGDVSNYAWLIHGYVILYLGTQNVFFIRIGNACIQALICFVISVILGHLYLKLVNSGRLFRKKETAVLQLGLLIAVLVISLNYYDWNYSWYKNSFLCDNNGNILNKTEDLSAFRIRYNKIYYNVDVLKEEKDGTYISGWAYSSDIKNDNYAIALVVDDEIYYCNRNKRKDVQETFGLENKMLGFNVHIKGNSEFKIWLIDNDNKVIYK